MVLQKFWKKNIDFILPTTQIHNIGGSADPHRTAGGEPSLP